MGYKLKRVIYETVQPGVYAARIKEVKEQEGTYGPQWQFVLSLDGTETELLAWASAKLSNKSKLGTWVQAILGEIPAELDTSDLEGRAVNVLVDVMKKEDGSEVNRVLNILRPKQTAKARPQPVPLTAQEEAEGVDELRI